MWKYRKSGGQPTLRLRSEQAPGCQTGRIQAVMATQPMPEEPELVTVFETEDEPEALVVQALLRSEGNIESVITGIDAPPDVLPGVGGIMIRVPVERAAEARAIIRDYRTFGDAEAGVEDEDPGDSPTK
jgi:hypothetical protein